MHANYDPFLARVINKYEGGYTWEKTDPGGPTKYGITCYDLAKSQGKVMDSMTDWAPMVQKLTVQNAEEIYWPNYAVPLRFNDLPSGIDCAMLDYGILSGVGRAQLVARRLLSLPVNAPFSSVVQVLNAQYASGSRRVKFINDLYQERAAFMKAIKDGKMWVTYGKGWSARLHDGNDYCLVLAQGQPVLPTPPDLSKVVTPRATNADLDHDKKVAGTAVVGAFGSLLAGVAGAPWWLLAVAVGGTLLAVFAYNAYLTAKNITANNTVHTSVFAPGA